MSNYKGLGPNTGIHVAAEDALRFAAERCGFEIANPDAPEYAEFCWMVTEWFFFDDWEEE